MEETVTPRPARARKPAKATALGPGRPPPAEKRPTVASVCRFLQELIQANAGLTQQVQTLAIRQQQLEKKTMMPAPLQPPYTGPFEPDYLICPQQSPQTSAVAKAIGIPQTSPAYLSGSVEISRSLGQSCPSPIEGPYCISLSDCIPGIGSNVGARDWEFWRRESGCTGRIEEGGVLSVGPHSHVQENAAHRSGRGLTRGDDDKRHLRHRIPGEVRRFWTTPRAWLLEASDYDHNGFSAGGKSSSCKRCHGPINRNVST